MSLSSSSKRLHGGRRCLQLHLSREQLLQQIGWVQHKFMVTIYCFIDQLIKTCVWFIIVINSCSVWVDDADRWTSDLRAVFDFRWVASIKPLCVTLLSVGVIGEVKSLPSLPPQRSETCQAPTALLSASRGHEGRTFAFLLNHLHGDFDKSTRSLTEISVACYLGFYV